MYNFKKYNNINNNLLQNNKIIDIHICIYIYTYITSVSVDRKVTLIYLVYYNTIYMGVPSYLSKGLIIRATTRPSRQCELMKLSVPLVSPIYAYAAFTVAAPKYWNSLPDELRTQSYFITFKCRLHSYMLSL